MATSSAAVASRDHNHFKPGTARLSSLQQAEYMDSRRYQAWLAHHVAMVQDTQHGAALQFLHGGFMDISQEFRFTSAVLPS